MVGPDRTLPDVPDAVTQNERVYLALRNDIVEGRLRPGQRLIELAIAERFGVSQGPVREGLRRLAQEALAITEPRRGTRVRQLRLAEIDDFFSVRSELEAIAARRFIERRTAKSEIALQTAFSAFSDTFESEHPVATLLQRDVQFHAAILHGADSPLLERIWESITVQWRGLRTLVAEYDLHSPAETIETHKALVTVLQGDDVEYAQRLLREHSLHAGQSLTEALRSIPEHRDLFAD